MSALKPHVTNKFSVLDLPDVLANAKREKEIERGKKREQLSRSNKEHGNRMETGKLIGGSFSLSRDPPYIKHRLDLFDSLWKVQEEARENAPEVEIKITLPSGDVRSGVALKTTPYEVAKGISQGLADSTIVAKVCYTGTQYDTDNIVACDDGDEAHGEGMAKSELTGGATSGQLWDMHRPLAGDCTLSLLKYDDPESKVVFSHSSAHVLGAALETVYGAHLTIGPPLQQGFYYDCFMGDHTVPESDLKKIEEKAVELTKKKHPFQRLVVTKEQALEMFSHNPFKVNLVTNKVPDNSKTTVYRCGHLIDLCMGPHVPHTGRIKAFSCVKASSTNWLGVVTNDPLQRVYGVSFPEKAQLKQWIEFQERAKQRDHRLLGTKQELFFFHTLSPGSAFWMPHGARIYNKLMDFIRKQYWVRGYEEVITPNVYNLDLWHTSGHAKHYKENMFIFEVEGAEWGVKPMNCPGHCLLFGHRLRSYRELPIRIGDFGVLHRNEISGALTGLTRVRRFQQDDAHIFCRPDQIKTEILAALDFMRFVYTVLGMTYQLELSTRPEKALGDIEVWNGAEAQLTEALNEFVGESNWKINPGDGAFYGPKIDIKVYDAMERFHQCATVQLDFQLPIRFGLEYKTDAAGEDSFARPVMIHRAMLGSVERMTAILAEHWGGKWPLWLSPRQVCIVPVDLKFSAYGAEVQEALHQAGYFVDLDDSKHKLNKKIREAQLAQYNFILVIGEKEKESKSVMVRRREGDANPSTEKAEKNQQSQDQVQMSIPDFIAMLDHMTKTYAM